MKTEVDHFLGEWNVSESVFDADATPIGMVAQSRRLYRKDQNRILVVQNCVPQLKLIDHDMNQFAGDFSFKIEKRDSFRAYLGPDVMGGAWSIGDQFLLGEGIWPRFGYQFKSWSISVSPDFQLTGGRFYRLSQPLATIIGRGTLTAAKPNTDYMVNRQWRAFGGIGIVYGRSFSHRRDCQGEFHRSITDTGWVDWNAMDGNYNIFNLTKGKGFYELEMDGIYRGFAKAYGPLLIWEMISAQDTVISGIEISLNSPQRRYSIRKIEDPKVGVTLQAMSF